MSVYKNRCEFIMSAFRTAYFFCFLYQQFLLWWFSASENMISFLLCEYGILIISSSLLIEVAFPIMALHSLPEYSFLVNHFLLNNHIMRITLIYHLEAHEWLCRMEKSGIFPNKQLNSLVACYHSYQNMRPFINFLLFFWVFPKRWIRHSWICFINAVFG